VIPPTEQRNPRSAGLDALDARGVIDLMHAEDEQVAVALAHAAPDLARAADAIATAYADGGRIAYVATGTSGFIAAMDAAELPPTFGVDPARYFALTTAAGAPSSLPGIHGAREDDEHAPVIALDARNLGIGDVVVGIAASGSTPIVCAAVAHARRQGCTTVGIANNPGTRLLQAADIPVLLDTGPEVLTGSTRLKAGTAQKVALNRISTAAMVRAGRVVSNLMVEVGPGNAKLRERCVRIVADIAGVPPGDARRRLEGHDWSVRDAIADTGP